MKYLLAILLFCTLSSISAQDEINNENNELVNTLYCKSIFTESQDLFKQNGIAFDAFEKSIYSQDTFSIEPRSYSPSYLNFQKEVIGLCIYKSFRRWRYEYNEEYTLFIRELINEDTGEKLTNNIIEFSLETSFIDSIISLNLNEIETSNTITGLWNGVSETDLCLENYQINFSKDNTFSQSFNSKNNCIITDKEIIVQDSFPLRENFVQNTRHILSSQKGYYKLEGDILIMFDLDFKNLRKYRLQYLDNDIIVLDPFFNSRFNKESFSFQRQK